MSHVAASHFTRVFFTSLTRLFHAILQLGCFCNGYTFPRAGFGLIGNSYNLAVLAA